MGVTIVSSPTLNEATTGLLTFQLNKVDTASTGTLALGELLTLTLTLYEAESGTILNSRDIQNILNINNVTISTTGLVRWQVQPADTAIIGTGLIEEHVALFRWTWAAGQQSEEIHFYVKNITKVP